ncbi:SseB protein N-terminal domain-containing protein [Saccharopolyspora kobensis]|uniref:SseB protein N-terminal domain-containing protein n=1 Tax=Saccharopolyspora kobensis TaxID=146035 RepID=A0A1H6CUB7_9PSEU|nr:SseB family protein [Saccharopolyspora kobensis]SEG76263.1 SseB protein N-terminal domain-containing protein [Saccharopolyspora kobensis]SFC98892.1 SseB protein N-terminal domain-containing protein [Saccharopolyspora kobensis]
MSVGDSDLTALARAVSAGERPVKAFYAAFAKAVVYARRPEKPGVFVTDTESQGRWTVAFTTLDRLAAHAGACDYISMPGAIFLELVPPGVGVMVDPDDDHRLPLVARVDDFFALEREWKRTAPARQAAARKAVR